MGVLSWWQVAIKPAKPLAFGLLRGVPLFGLPGNPVSSHVSFELFARPALRQMMGHADLHRPVVDAVAGRADVAGGADGKLHLDRVARAVRGRRLRRRAQPAPRRATCCRRWPRRTAWPCCPTATAPNPATPSK